MKVDKTILKIYNEIIDEIHKEENIVLSIEEVHAIFVSQLDGFKHGVVKNEPIHWVLFGKFLPLDRKNKAIEARNFKEDLKERKELFPELDAKAITAEFAATKALEKEALSNTLRNSKPIGLKSLLVKPNASNYNKCKFKLINERK
jgi:hypothetical protein